MNNKYTETAMDLQKAGYNCCQSTVTSMCEAFGIDQTTALRFAAAFGTGIGWTAETCGAITGSMMILGLCFRSNLDTPADFSINDKAYEIAAKFVSQFKEIHDGKFRCIDLLGVDPRTESGQQYIEKYDLYTCKCRKYIRDGVALMSELLKEYIPGEDEGRNTKCQKKH